MTEPDDFGFSALATLAHVGEPTRSIRHVAFWKNWTTAVFAERPRLVPRDSRAADPSDPSATHEFVSCRAVRIGCTLLMPRGKPRAALVVAHGYEGVPSLAESAEEWKPLADDGLAVLILRVRGYAGSQADVPQLVAHSGAIDGGGGGQWITHGLESPLSDHGLGSEWAFSYAVADTVNACRALRGAIAADPPLLMSGESFGGALCILAASALSESDEIARLAIGLPSMGDWPWRLALPERRTARGAGGLVRRFVADHADRAEEITTTLRVFDAVIHARRVRGCVLCKLATLDDAVPAPSAAAVFNALGADPGRKWRCVVKYGHFDGGIADLRRHAGYAQLAQEFLTNASLPCENFRELSDLDPSKAAPGKRAGSPVPPRESDPESLFGPGPAPADPDEPLIQAYVSGGRTLDDLPYTPEFERLFRAAAAGRSEREVFHRLHNLRKAGRLPRLGKPASLPPRLDAGGEARLAALVVEAVGSLGQRDQLPYTQAFDSLVERFNQQAGRTLAPHDVWRLIAKLAK